MLTPNEEKYLAYILEFQIQHDRSPTYQELMTQFKVGKSYIPKVLTGLEKKGKIKRAGRQICMNRSHYCQC